MSSDIQVPLHTGAFAQKLLRTEALTQMLLHRCIYTQNFDTEARVPSHTDALHTDAFTHKCFYTQKFLRTAAFAYRKLLYTRVLPTDVSTRRHFTHKGFAHGSCYTQKVVLHTESLYTQTEAFTYRTTWRHIICRTFTNQKTTKDFTYRKLCTRVPLHTDIFIHRSSYTQKREQSAAEKGWDDMRLIYVFLIYK